MNTSTHTNFIWEHPWSNHLETDRKTPSSAAADPVHKWGIYFILEPKIYGATKQTSETQVIDDIALDQGSVTSFKYIPEPLTIPKSILFQMKAWRSNFQVNWRRKSYVFTKGGSEFMKTLRVKWQVCGRILVDLHMSSHWAGTVRTKGERNSKHSVPTYKAETAIDSK